MSTTEVIMPQMGESIAEGTITRWLVKEGGRVERDQPLLEISTDKVDAEIPSPASGTLFEVRYQEGETVEVDTVIALIGPADSRSAAAGSSVASDAGAPAVHEIAASPTPHRGTLNAPPHSFSAPVVSGEESNEDPLLSRLRHSSSPVVRNIAAEHGVNIREVSGTGIHGRVTKTDILQYLERSAPDSPVRGASPVTTAPNVPKMPEPDVSQSRAPQQAARRAAPRPASSEMVRGETAPVPARTAPAGGDFSFHVPAFSEGERVSIEPMSRIRRLTAAHMLYSQQTSAHVATVFEVDFSSVVAARALAKEGFVEKTGTKLTFMPFIFKAVVDGLRAYPKFNASVDATNVVLKKDIHLGMAVALDWGLLVPVIHHADQLNLVGLARAANDLADRARTKKLRPEEVQHGTFTITNPGVFGSLFGTPIINQPQVAILCVGAIEKRPIIVTDAQGNDGISIRSMAYFCLSYDHRLIDGSDAEQFMLRVKKTLEQGSWDELAPYRPD